MVFLVPSICNLAVNSTYWGNLRLISRRLIQAIASSLLGLLHIQIPCLELDQIPTTS